MKFKNKWMSFLLIGMFFISTIAFVGGCAKAEALLDQKADELISKLLSKTTTDVNDILDANSVIVSGYVIHRESMNNVVKVPGARLDLVVQAGNKTETYTSITNSVGQFEFTVDNLYSASGFTLNVYANNYAPKTVTLSKAVDYLDSSQTAAEGSALTLTVSSIELESSSATYGSISGEIKLDYQDFIRPGRGVTASLKDKDNNDILAEKSMKSFDGRFSFFNLEEGEYKVALSKDGFASVISDLITIPYKATDDAEETMHATDLAFSLAATTATIDTAKEEGDIGELCVRFKVPVDKDTNTREIPHYVDVEPQIIIKELLDADDNPVKIPLRSEGDGFSFKLYNIPPEKELTVVVKINVMKDPKDESKGVESFSHDYKLMSIKSGALKSTIQALLGNIEISGEYQIIEIGEKDFDMDYMMDSPEYKAYFSEMKQRYDGGNTQGGIKHISQEIRIMDFSMQSSDATDMNGNMDHYKYSKPLSNANIKFKDYDNNLIGESTTDDNGWFNAHIYGGNHKMEIYKDGDSSPVGIFDINTDNMWGAFIIKPDTMKNQVTFTSQIVTEYGNMRVGIPGALIELVDDDGNVVASANSTDATSNDPNNNDEMNKGWFSMPIKTTEDVLNKDLYVRISHNEDVFETKTLTNPFQIKSDPNEYDFLWEGFKSGLRYLNEIKVASKTYVGPTVPELRGSIQFNNQIDLTGAELRLSFEDLSLTVQPSGNIIEITDSFNNNDKKATFVIKNAPIYDKQMKIQVYKGDTLFGETDGFHLNDSWRLIEALKQSKLTGEEVVGEIGHDPWLHTGGFNLPGKQIRYNFNGNHMNIDGAVLQFKKGETVSTFTANENGEIHDIYLPVSGEYEVSVLIDNELVPIYNKNPWDLGAVTSNFLTKELEGWDDWNIWDLWVEAESMAEDLIKESMFTLNGRTKTHNDDPIENVIVNCYMQHDEDLEKALNEKPARTNSNGEFSLSIPTGVNVKIVAQKEGYGIEKQDVWVDMNNPSHHDIEFRFGNLFSVHEMNMKSVRKNDKFYFNMSAKVEKKENQHDWQMDPFTDEDSSIKVVAVATKINSNKEEEKIDLIECYYDSGTEKWFTDGTNAIYGIEGIFDTDLYVDITDVYETYEKIKIEIRQGDDVLYASEEKKDMPEPLALADLSLDEDIRDNYTTIKYRNPYRSESTRHGITKVSYDHNNLSTYYALYNEDEEYKFRFNIHSNWDNWTNNTTEDKAYITFTLDPNSEHPEKGSHDEYRDGLVGTWTIKAIRKDTNEQWLYGERLVIQDIEVEDPKMGFNHDNNQDDPNNNEEPGDQMPKADQEDIDEVNRLAELINTDPISVEEGFELTGLDTVVSNLKANAGDNVTVGDLTNDSRKLIRVWLLMAKKNNMELTEEMLNGLALLINAPQEADYPVPGDIIVPEGQEGPLDFIQGLIDESNPQPSPSPLNSPVVTVEFSNDNVEVTWTHTDEEERAGIKYQVYRKIGESGNLAKVGEEQSEMSFTDATVSDGETYYYQVEAKLAIENEDPLSAMSNDPVSIEIPEALDAPNFEVLVRATGDVKVVEITWDELPEGSEIKIYRSATLNGTNTALDNPVLLELEIDSENRIAVDTEPLDPRAYYTIKVVKDGKESDFVQFDNQSHFVFMN